MCGDPRSCCLQLLSVLFFHGHCSQGQDKQFGSAAAAALFAAFKHYLHNKQLPRTEARKQAKMNIEHGWRELFYSTRVRRGYPNPQHFVLDAPGQLARAARCLSEALEATTRPPSWSAPGLQTPAPSAGDYTQPTRITAREYGPLRRARRAAPDVFATFRS